MTGRRARIAPGDLAVAQHGRGEVERELHAGRAARRILVVGDLPEPGAATAGEQHARRDRAPGLQETDDTRLAVRRQPGDIARRSCMDTG